MDSSHLNAQQAGKLKADIARQLRYLNKLCGRMQQLRFPVDDPLWQATLRARNAVQDLHVAAHYSGCKEGVGRDKAEG